MDAVIAVINAYVSATLAAALTWAVLTRRVRDGVVIKAGLVSMALGFWVLAAMLTDGLDCTDLTPVGRALLLIHVGVLIVLVGAALHLHAGRRLQDLLDLEHVR